MEDEMTVSVAWPSVDFIKAHKCSALFIKASENDQWAYSIFAFDASEMLDSEPALWSWYLQIDPDNRTVCIKSGSPVRRIVSNPYVPIAIINTWALAISKGYAESPLHPSMYMCVIETDAPTETDNMHLIQTIMIGVRLRVMLLRRICQDFREKPKVYRYHHGCAKKIQRVWRRAITNPEYTLCRKRLLCEFHDMT